MHQIKIKPLLIASLILWSNLLLAQTATQAIIYTTAKGSSYKLSPSDTLSFKESKQPLETQICLFIDNTKTFQEMQGIGAAITDASAETFAKVSAAAQEELLNAFFDKNTGIGYSLARTNIHSCDFSSESYTYILEGDKELNSFNIEHDLSFRIPLLKKAFAKTNNELKLFASPWSPPAFMKDNNNMLQGGKLLPAYYQSWATYFVKFITAYQAAGVPIWGVSVQNEPMAKQRWESCIYTAEEERDFLKNYLGPTLKNNGFGNKKIIVWDHNRDLLFHRANTILSDPAAAAYVWGVGYHWYETWTGAQQQHDNLSLVKQVYPNTNLIFTEGCKESFNKKKYKNWDIGEYYADAMIKDFNRGVCAWTDWNIFLDETGGPNHVQNFCFAPVHVNTKTSEIIYTNAFYYIGHFSKFIRPGDYRVACSSSRSTLQASAFINAQGKTSVVVLNKGDKAISYMLYSGTKMLEVTCAAHSIQTIVF
ncbi:MAG: glycosyl hydrolase [Bacteroidetes bacterium B1(2017)]|nr:MAG: glycosyl hydrolase [Bacteroidetes bacterium B1(2017)]